MHKNNLTPILVGLAFLTFVGVVWYAFSNQKEAAPLAIPESKSNTALSRVPPAGWKEYRNAAYAISFFYPEELVMKEFKEIGSAMTVTFEDEAGGKEFQMFVVPYLRDDITPERFQMDVPSGVREKETDIEVAAARGKQFYSQDARLGETYEIWFIHNGFLYEVTTHKELDIWIKNILATLIFLKP